MSTWADVGDEGQGQDERRVQETGAIIDRTIHGVHGAREHRCHSQRDQMVLVRTLPDSQAPEEQDTALFEVDQTGDIIMEDIQDEVIVQAITKELSESRNQRQAGRTKLPFDVLRQRLPHELDCIFVVDTNFIISHLSIVRSLVGLSAHAAALILIPWVVIQELDGLKTADRNYGEANLATLARSAVRFIYETLQAAQGGLRGQKISETINSSEVGDDAILDCGRYWTERQGRSVILLSNDKNLCTKFMIHSIAAISHEVGLTANEILSRSLESWSGSIDPRTAPKTRRPEQTNEATDTSMEVDEPIHTARSKSVRKHSDQVSDDIPIEMETDPVLPPLVHSKVLRAQNPFASLEANAVPSIYDSSRPTMPVRGVSPSDTRQKRTTFIEKEKEKEKLAGDYELFDDIYITMTKALPRLLRAKLLAEFQDEESVNFMMGCPAWKDTNLDLPALMKIISDNWFAVFGHHIKSVETVKTRGSKASVYQTRSLEMIDKLKAKTLTAQQSRKVVEFFSLTWKDLSGLESEKYRLRRDKYIAKWHEFLEGLASTD